MSFAVATFYKFVELPDYTEMQPALLEYCQALDLRGTILLAAEGINGTIAGDRASIDAVLAHLRSDPRLYDLDPKESSAETFPFRRMKVKIKREIVTLGAPEANPNTRVGIYASARDWNQLIVDPEVTLIDTRNEYEVAIGSFRGACHPATQSFREFPDYVDRHLNPETHAKIALFCTGGIRCEKATSYLLARGFKHVYHLQGGILNYLEVVPEAESLWEGECFVFDERVAVRHGLAPGSYDMCRACGYPISDADKASPKYRTGTSCPHCYDKK